MCHFDMRIIVSLRQFRPCRLKWNSYLSLKEFKYWALPITRVISRELFLCSTYRPGKTSNYWISALLIILWMTSLTSEAPMSCLPLFPFLLLNLLAMWSLWLYQVCRVPTHTYLIKFGCFLLINMSRVDLIISSGGRLKRIEESFFLPQRRYWQLN